MPGLIPTYRGTPTTDRYQAGTLFIDHASRFLHFTPHISTGGKEAITAKHNFELLASTYNHPIKCYHTDNGIFASKEFCSSCIQQNQHIKFCGVNAHHQNGIAERHIHTITEQARSMLIHAMISWPDIIQETLWPYAFCLAIDLHNCTPTSSGLTPEEIFTGIKGRNRLLDFHPFGCPIFVLDPLLQQGHKIPRWKPRSRVGVYLGLSPNHASSVPLILSTTTGLVSPQFHVVFDDHFTTTNSLHDNALLSNWSTLFSTSSFKYVDETFDPSSFTDPSWFNDDNSSSSSLQREPTIDSSSSSTILDSSSSPLLSTTLPSSSFQREDSSANIPPRSGWNRAHHYETRFRKRFTTLTTVLDETSSTPFDESLYLAFISVQDFYPINSSSELSFLEHYACAAKSNSDVLHYGAMIRDPDRSFFETDMQREVSNLFRTNTVELVLRASVPLGLKILSAIWSFHCKRAPDWSILKYKSCVLTVGSK
jgi:hypothetical protein